MTSEKEKKYPKFGEIYFFAASRHSGDSKVRPGIIVSKDSVNSRSKSVQIVPLTRDKKIQNGLYAVRFLIPTEQSGLDYDSVAMCDKATTILKSRLKEKAKGKLSKNYIEHLKKCLQMSHENAPVVNLSLFGR